MASITKIAGLGTNDTSIGSVAWSDPNRITADDGSFSGAGDIGTNITRYIKATNFGFNIPEGAAIDGIVITLGDRGMAAGNGNDHSVRIVKGGTIGSTERSQGAALPSGSFENKSFGSSTDMWGEEWTVEDFSDPGFGVVWAVQGGGSVAVPVIDYITITVHYSNILNFYSKWNIDKIIDFQSPSTNPNLSITLGGGNSTTVTVPHSYGFRPYVIAQYKPSTQGAWYGAGVNTQVSSEQLVEMYVWSRTNDIRFRVRNFHLSSVSIDIRYWVLSDGN